MKKHRPLSHRRQRSARSENSFQKNVALIEILGLDPDGELQGRFVNWQGRGPAPQVFVFEEKEDELSAGDRVLAAVQKKGKNIYEARIVKSMDEEALPTIIGIFKSAKGGGFVTPADKKIKHDYFLESVETRDLLAGDLVLIAPIRERSRKGRKGDRAHFIKKLGVKDDPRLISLIAIHTHGIPTVFSDAALAQAAAFSEPILGAREDLRRLPLVTIDGADARDFDDAVYAQRAKDGGWHLIVAIADVSAYVTPRSPLDQDAFERGNSTYFADRVAPMLPERMSNDLCSLRPKVDRACLAVDLWIDDEGRLQKWRFFRGLMRSAARLTYDQVEDAHQGRCDSTTAPLKDTVIKPLYQAYAVLQAARLKRGALDIDLPERKAIIDDTGRISAIVPRMRYDSHRLIEEFMILANVAAAEALRDRPCLYRIHAPPSFDKLESTRDFLKDFGYNLPRGDTVLPKNISHLLKISADRPEKELIHTVLLRLQSQAVYAPENIGHFGLALKEYAHFTSPIRRYADLVVHRALVKTFGLGEGGLTAAESESLDEIGAHISTTERRSMLAERETMDRFTAQYLAAHVGQEYAAKISGVTRFGLFVTLRETGADGLVPIRTLLPTDIYIHDEDRHALIGKRHRRVYQLAQPVTVRLQEADPLRGSMVLSLVETAEKKEGQRRKPKQR